MCTFAVGLCTSSFSVSWHQAGNSSQSSTESGGSPRAVCYYHTCLPGLPAFILGTLECVDKSTYGCLMAHNKIISHITLMSTQSRWKKWWFGEMSSGLCIRKEPTRAMTPVLSIMLAKEEWRYSIFPRGSQTRQRCFQPTHLKFEA